jgi:NADH-quinone oxidoreductase subunit M
MKDLSPREFWTLAPVIALIVWIGVYPNPFLRKLDVSVAELMERVNAKMIATETYRAAGDAETAISESPAGEAQNALEEAP